MRMLRVPGGGAAAAVADVTALVEIWAEAAAGEAMAVVARATLTTPTTARGSGGRVPSGRACFMIFSLFRWI